MCKSIFIMRQYIGTIIILLTALTVRSQQSTNEVDNDISIIKDFITSVADEELRADVILSQHLLIKDELSNDTYDYLEASVQEIRLNLQNRKLEDIQYLPFNKLPRKETKDIDPEGKPTDKMYFLRYKDRPLLAVYIEADKIASFTLVSKGNNMAHFVTY